MQLLFLLYPTPIKRRHTGLPHTQGRWGCGQSTPDCSTVGRKLRLFFVTSLSPTMITTFYTAHKDKDRLKPKVPDVSSMSSFVINLGLFTLCILEFLKIKTP